MPPDPVKVILVPLQIVVEGATVIVAEGMALTVTGTLSVNVTVHVDPIFNASTLRVVLEVMAAEESVMVAPVPTAEAPEAEPPLSNW